MNKVLSVQAVAVVALLVTGAGCAASSTSGHSGHGSSTPSTSSMGSGHSSHKMDGGPAPAGIKAAASPKYAVGSKVKLLADHMPGMKDATGTIAGAFTTTTYAVDYTPTNGGPKVTNHKWVVQEELANPGTAPKKVGDVVKLEAEHMDGMKGAEATVSGVSTATVYMVDYVMDAMPMTNHKWVTEDEIAPLS